MKSSKKSTLTHTWLLLFTIFLIFGCIKKGILIDNSDDFQLVVVPSAMEVEVGDTVNFDIILLGEIIEADLYIDSTKISGHKYVFEKRGIYTVHAQKEGVKNSDSVTIIVGGDFEKIELSIVGYAQGPSGVRDYIFKTEVNGDTISADIYVDDEMISGTSHTFNPRQEPYLVYAKKTDYITSDTLLINVAPVDKFKLFVRASETDVSVDTEVTFTAGYVNVEPITVEGADFYVNGEKIAGNKYTFREAGTYTVVAKKESFEDSDSITITVKAISSYTVYVAGYIESSSSRKRFAHYWKYYTGGSLSSSLDIGLASDACEANGITIDTNGDIYIPGKVEDYSREHYSALYWKRESRGGLTRVILKEGNAESTSITIDDGNVYSAGRIDGHPVYWKNKTLIDLAETGSDDWFVATDITTYNGDVYISGGDYADDAPSDSKAFYWKNNASGKVSLTGDGTGGVATGIAVHNGNVYVSGASLSRGRAGQAVYWFNGDVVTLSEGIANDITVTANGDVYLAGWIHDDGRGYAVYWKNGVMKKLSKDNASADAYSIAVAPNGEVYIAGSQRVDGANVSTALYWKVDETQNVKEIKLSDGTNNAEARAIYLSED